MDSSCISDSQQDHNMDCSVVVPMTIFCKICGTKIHSDLPAATANVLEEIQPGQQPTNAQMDVLIKMSTHLGKHPQQAQSLAALIVVSRNLLSTYLLIKKYVRIPDNEKELLDSFDINEGALIDLFALEPAESKPKN